MIAQIFQLVSAGKPQARPRRHAAAAVPRARAPWRVAVREVPELRRRGLPGVVEAGRVVEAGHNDDGGAHEEGDAHSGIGGQLEQKISSSTMS